MIFSHVEQRHGGRRDAVPVSRIRTWSGRAHETARLDVGDDDGGKTPGTGSSRIQGWENDDTQTLPKLPTRVEAEVATAGETASGSERFTRSEVNAGADVTRATVALAAATLERVGKAVDGRSPGFLLQGGAAVAREPHKLQVIGSNPVLASKNGGSHAPTPPTAGPLHQASGGLNTETCLRMVPLVGRYASGKDCAARGGASALKPRALDSRARTSFDTGQGTGTIAPAVSARCEQLANPNRKRQRDPRPRPHGLIGVDVQGARVAHRRKHTSWATDDRWAVAEKKSVVEAPTPWRHKPLVALNPATHVSEILGCSLVDPGANPGESTSKKTVGVSAQHLGSVVRPAPVSESLTESSVSQRRAEQPVQLGRAT